MFSSRRLWKCCEVLLRRPGWTKVHAAFVRQLSTCKCLQSLELHPVSWSQISEKGDNLFVPQEKSKRSCFHVPITLNEEPFGFSQGLKATWLRSIHSFSDRERRGIPSVTVTGRTSWQRTLWRIWIVLSFSLKRDYCLVLRNMHCKENGPLWSHQHIPSFFGEGSVS